MNIIDACSVSAFPIKSAVGPEGLDWLGPSVAGI